MQIRYPAIKIGHKNGEYGAGKAGGHRVPDSVLEISDFSSAMAENSRDVIFRVHYRPEFGYDYVSQSAVHITGYTPEEFYADPLLIKKCILPEDFNLVGELFPPGAPIVYEPTVLRWRRKDGRIIWTEHYININRDAQGQPETGLVIARDVTERKMTEEALQIEKNKLESVIDAMMDALTMINRDFEIVFQNERARQSSGDHLGEKCYRAYVHIDNVCEGCPVALAFRDGQPHTFEKRRLERSGETTCWENTASPVKDAGGKVIICLEIGHEITERTRAEKALQESQRFASSLLENAPHATMVINPDTSVRYVNPAWERLNGWTLGEVVGRKAPYSWWPKDIKNEEFLPVFIEAIHQPVGKGEIVAVKKTGESYWIDMNWVSVTEDGEFQYVIINSVDITERKKAEEKRQAILKTALDGFCTNDLDGKFLEVNDAYCAMTGYTREELLKMSIQDMDVQTTPQELEVLAKSIVEKGYARLETKHKCKDGRIIGIELSSKYPNTGEPQVYSFIRDITERKKVEAALKESEEKFSAAFHSSPSSISISRLDSGQFIEVNESFLRDKGYTREEVIGNSALANNIPESPDEIKSVVKTLKAGGKVRNEVLRFRTKSGSIRTGLLSAKIINVGNEPCLLVLNNDITKQKQAEEQLRLLSSVTQQVSDSIMITDPRMRITYINRAAQDLLGYAIDEIRGKDLAYFHVIPPTEKTKREVKECINQGKVWNQTVTKKRKDGRFIICDCWLSPLYDEEGHICSYIDVERDVTEQKEVEVKLKAQKQLIESILSNMLEGVLVIDAADRVILANEAARHIFRRRSSAMQNQPLKDVIPAESLLKLYDDVKLGKKQDGTLEFRYQVNNIDKIIACGAVRMDEARTLLTFTDVSREREEKEKLYLTDRLASIGEMAVGLAHELNNPLTGIISLSQLLVDSDIPPEPKEDLLCINSEARRAANIVKNVLLFTRNNNYENGRASVNDVVRDVLRLREYEEKTNNISVVTNLQDDLPDVLIDRFQLQQVVLNIILNAEAAIKEVKRPGLLTITTEKMNRHVNILLSDNGCGIKKNVLTRIFDPFFTTKEIGKGTGLGLSICYGIVTQHRGKISVKTQVNRGTTFTLRMPASQKRT